MHQLALELHTHGHVVTGSDDEIYDPALSNLKEAGLLPDEMGWDSSRINSGIDIVILGMHAHLDNPELSLAQALSLKIMSFPEFYGFYTRDKQKIVVCGSHGKTTTTAMIIHALHKLNIEADYLLGGELQGLDRMVRISQSSKIAIIEGDEYLSSRLDPRPKMLLYHGNIVVVTGIAWDHMNVFPSFENYKDQFRQLIDQLDEKAILIFCQMDKDLADLVAEFPRQIAHPYSGFEFETGQIFYDGNAYSLQIFGNHNMENLQAGMLACKEIGISPHDFLSSMNDFRGAGNRLELISEKPSIYLDYAHAPSKVEATVKAIRYRYPKEKVLAIYELHTYSSLNINFLPQYAGTLDLADQGIVYYDQHALKIKRMPPLEKSSVAIAFENDLINVYTSPEELENYLDNHLRSYDVILFMSSGKFGGLRIDKYQNVSK